jgi:hypothetical protein
MINRNQTLLSGFFIFQLAPVQRGELALAFNDSPDNSKINKGRARLRVAMSCDGGQRWDTISELEAG